MLLPMQFDGKQQRRDVTWSPIGWLLTPTIRVTCRHEIIPTCSSYDGGHGCVSTCKWCIGVSPQDCTPSHDLAEAPSCSVLTDGSNCVSLAMEHTTTTMIAGAGVAGSMSKLLNGVAVIP